MSTNRNKLSNPLFIGTSGTFEFEVFVFVVINKVLNIMNIFEDERFSVFEFEKEFDVRFFANF
ncbi:MAG: hypothetical protein J6Z02_03505, partial [Lachnospiraceae bacterium]|nr:hypothetical protein [Lachnospiraceae bacterium]